MLLAAALYSCSKSNTNAVSPGTNPGNPVSCDTTNMKYTANVLPVLKANCYSCHGNGNSQNGITLDSYAAVKKQADNGNLVAVITHAAGYPAMPQGAAKLSDCDINTIRDWIARGTINN